MSPAPRETAAAFWAALYDRDWPRIRSFFGAESIYYDVPTGPSAAGVGPESIEARLRLGLEGLTGYEHRPGVVAEGADGVVVTEHTEVWTWETGETVALPFVSVQRIVDGVIVLWKDYWDFQTLMGAAPAAWHERLDTADLSWVVDVTGRRVTTVAGGGLRLPDPCLVVLVGVSGSGKSTWAARHFAAAEIVSSDALRGVVGLHERDQRASKDAFAVLDQIVDVRLRRGLTTVVDSTGLEAKQRAAWIAMARRHQRPVHAVLLAVPERQARARNKDREHPVPPKIVTAELRSLESASEAVADEGFDAVHHLTGDEPVALVPPRFVTAPATAVAHQEAPVPLRFTFHVGRFERFGKGPQLADDLRHLARLAEEAGFHAMSVMDHVVQIPTVGPEWEALPESTTTLGFLAGATERLRLGALVNGVTYRNLAQLGKQVATLDVVSGGRAFCGLGLAWHQREHELYGWTFPSVAERYEMLEDALELFPLLWGPGQPRFEGRTVTVPEAICYPRPIQERIPIIVGGSGERRTLRLVARHADGCNLLGDPDEVRHKVAVLHEHCAAEARDPTEIAVTQLSDAAVMAPGGERYADTVGTVVEQVGRYRELADAGVDEAFVALHEDGSGEQVERFAEVIAAFA